MKKLFSILFALVAVVMLSSCCFVSPDADEETVLVKKPWFFGHGGVDNDPVQSGLTWCALSYSCRNIQDSACTSRGCS